MTNSPQASADLIKTAPLSGLIWCPTRKKLIAKKFDLLKLF
jgi:hypothetical protein